MWAAYSPDKGVSQRPALDVGAYESGRLGLLWRAESTTVDGPIKEKGRWVGLGPLKPIVFEMPGVPRNFTNRREHWAKAWREKQAWWATTALLGTAMRKRAGWELAQPGQLRSVVITCFRVRLMDDDGNCISVKSIRDALQVKTLGKSEQVGERRISVPKIGAGLISSDGDAAVSIVVKQLKVAKYKQQRVVVSVEAVA